MIEELTKLVPGLRTWATKFSGRHYDTDDLVSDVIISFLERPDRWDPSKGPLRNYLFSCVRNRSFDALRTYNRKGRKRLRRYLRTEAPLYLIEECPISREETKLDLEKKVDLLPKRLSEPFRLFALEGKKYREIAELLGIREGYAKCLIHRARVKLRELLASAG